MKDQLRMICKFDVITSGIKQIGGMCCNSIIGQNRRPLNRQAQSSSDPLNLIYKGSMGWDKVGVAQGGGEGCSKSVLVQGKLCVYELC